MWWNVHLCIYNFQKLRDRFTVEYHIFYVLQKQSSWSQHLHHYYVCQQVSLARNPEKDSDLEHWGNFFALVAFPQPPMLLSWTYIPFILQKKKKKTLPILPQTHCLSLPTLSKMWSVFSSYKMRPYSRQSVSVNHRGKLFPFTLPDVNEVFVFLQELSDIYPHSHSALSSSNFLQRDKISWAK